MSEPIHPGMVLRDRVLPGLGLRVIQAARDLQTGRQTLRRILAGSAAVTEDLDARPACPSGGPNRF